MIYRGAFVTVRSTYLQSFRCASQLRGKLAHFEKSSEVIRKSEAELKRRAEKRRLELKKLNKTPYTQQHAKHILKKRYEVQEEILNSSQLGPTSESDLKFMKLAHDKRLLYTMLGVTGEQLRDSKLVARDISKFLARNQLEKALFLARLAKGRGIVGMNKIIEYFCKEQHDAKSAIDLYNWRKKWGIQPNDFTHTILFDGLAKIKQPLSDKQAQRVLKIAKQLIEKEEINSTEFNAALSALANCVTVDYLFELFDARPKSIINDSITYTILLRGSSTLKEDRQCMKRVDAIMASIPKRFLDARIMFEYCRVLHNRQDHLLSSVAVKALNKYFDLGADLEQLTFPSGVVLPELQYWDIKKQFKPDAYVLDLFFNNCEKNKLYDLAWKSYEQFASQKGFSLKPSTYETIIKVATAGFPTQCAERAIRVFEDFDAKHKASKNSMLLVYKAFERQAGRKYTNADESRVDLLLQSLFDFSVRLESKHWEGVGTGILNWKAWMFCWNIINKSNERGKVSNEKAKWVLDHYLKTVLTGQTRINGMERKDYSALRHVSIESVRFITTFADRFRVDGVVDGAELTQGPLRDRFLYRRLLLRFKDRILDKVEILEGGSGIAESVEESIKQTAQKLAFTKPPTEA